MSRAPVAIALAALLLAGCGTDDPGLTTAPRPAVQTEVVSAAAEATAVPATGGSTVVLEPKKPNGGLVVYVHGAGETAESIRTDPQKAPMVVALLDAGYSVAAADADGDAWGTPASVAAYEVLADRVPHKRLYVIGQSMGGLAAMQLADKVSVRAMALIYPVCDLASMNDGPYRNSIAAAWGDNVDQGLLDLSPVAPARPVQIHAWASPDDTVVNRDENTLACTALAEQRGSDVQVTETVGDHGDDSNFDAAAVLTLFDGS